mmetsp:Transcript_7877/g.9368  ORF Transcript_7877/g.9368 Transcript_7877/m.9368 type:complete len:353 (-) Transcript_7877:29-1087(-)|eukprot:CAMPEP_0204867038 /NCGR_PEP_ID=MMETSP1348-20121228/20791_1 /ASSEMBLY_ACC=CAM_ASM_000700 /TAXON_ID=215587 /ORGANISM="Aplanochytrium stocchinoi, Strain GSBS06" /LENGTH=352 /DNA_ID=CAMNT_0052019265 /DNA_START=60 /DNA_END=1118 /DNA_ORIENTATION=+
MLQRLLQKVCEPWDMGADCGFDQRIARIVILVILVIVFLATVFLTVAVHKRNNYWMSRPVLCLVLCAMSLLLDITEHSIILSSMDKDDYDKYANSWYGTSTFDSCGDIFLMASLCYFASIWCDNIALIRTQANKDLSPSQRYKGLQVITVTYFLILLVTMPVVVAFAISSYKGDMYDTVALVYSGWGAISGIFLLTPISWYMRILVKQINLPEKAPESQHRALKQLTLQAQVNWWEQVLWNIFLVIAIITLAEYLNNGNESSALIGTATVSIQITFLLLHAQIIGFFAFVPRARHASPVFDEHLLRTLLDSGEVEYNKGKKDSITDVLDEDMRPIGEDDNDVHVQDEEVAVV